MKPQYILVVLAMLAKGALAQEATAAVEPAQEPVMPPVLEPMDATELSLDAFLWVARPIAVFADTPADPRFQQQLELLLARPEALVDRDVVILVDTDPAARSDVRTQLRPRGFSMVLLAKDGTVVLRKPSPWDVREITRAIDKLPLRQDEIKAGR